MSSTHLSADIKFIINFFKLIFMKNVLIYMYYNTIKLDDIQQ